MSDQFKALILNQDGENFTREIKSIDKSFLKHGDVTVKVHYSGLNYKDALILKNGARLVKEFPHIPGIDFSGIVEDSNNDKFKKGDEVILTGWRVGEIYFGALGGEISAISVNPAASSIFLSSELSVTANTFNNEVTSSYFNNKNINSFNGVDLSQAGIVVVLKDEGSSKWSKISFGFNYQVNLEQPRLKNKVLIKY